MTRRIIYFTVSLALLSALAACSTIQSLIGGQANAPAGAQQANPGGRGFFNQDPAKMTVEQKMGIGILKLEGSPNAISAQQAKDLLPLWQALKSMQNSDTAAIDEINALFSQMKESLTPEQVTAIETMTWTPEDMQALMQQYGGFPGGGNGQFTGTVSPEQQATRQARIAAGGGGGFGGQRPDGGGFGGPGGNGQNSSGPTRTPSPAQLNRTAMGLNGLFITPVIKLLTEKSGS